MAIPTTQTAITIPQIGGIDVLQYNTTALVPSLSSGHVIVKNAYAGINYIDTYFRTGLYKAPSYPHTLGREASGIIVQVAPDVTGFAVGDHVVYMSPGADAQYTAVSEASLVRVPADITLDVAAAAFLQGLTAWTFIRESADVRPGQWALVHAAAGGVGGLLVQLLKSVGAKVVGTASSAEKRELVKELGADVVLDSKASDWVQQVKTATNGHGVDVVFDGVGKATFDGDIDAIARKGTLISFGNASGAVPPVEIFRLTPKNIKLLRPAVNAYVATREELDKYSGELFTKITQGQLRVPIHKVYPMKEVAQAHTDIESRTTVGKLLLKID
ncbi:putative quinone oxidoreductase [Ceratocystis platani]|uniref:Probable quinone oxidoreductase n=1 Tax=Ceratocystis fimbriata f. sp. platani TaxID=88771 RepID=A0A0F8B6W8_CERFI|nr:putative quinone oxidoreductase [Ceratocystis platani]